MTAEIREALSHIPSGDRAVWIEVAFALKSEIPDGLDLFDSWSSTAENYSRDAVAATWKSAKASGGIGIGTLFHHAKAYGWKPGPDYKEPSPAELQARQKANAARDRAEARQKAKAQADAAKKAQWIIGQCQKEPHDYLQRKGFPDMLGLVWNLRDDEHLLVIPMYHRLTVVGCQLIDRDGQKKFLKGQRTSGAEFIIGSGGRDWLVEGYTTGLSLAAALGALKQTFRIHVCFSAGNMVKIAAERPDCLVIADNDASVTGLKAAEKIGRPYWMSDRVGEDFNDYSSRVRLFKASQSIRGLAMK